MDSWHSTPERDGVWVEREGSEPEYSVEQIDSAIQRAVEAGDPKAVRELSRYRHHYYTEEVHTRINRSELIEAAGFFGLCLLLLIVPISMNYIRCGRFRLWNPSAPESIVGSKK